MTNNSSTPETTFSRVWAMPNPNTFDIPAVSAFLDKWLVGRSVVVDPFARESTRGTHRNDLDPTMPTDFHLDAAEFCDLLVGQGVQADAVLFDPPYSPRQITECYKRIGLSVTAQDTQNARLYKRVRDGLDCLLQSGGVALSFGWNSGGFGVSRGYELVDVLLVAHGGAHNDTICVAERKQPTAVSTEGAE